MYPGSGTRPAASRQGDRRQEATSRRRVYDALMTETAVETPTFRHFIAGEWCESTSGDDLREPQPGRHARRRRALPAGDRGRRRDGHQGRRDRRPDVAPDAGAQAWRDPVRVRGPDGRAQGTARPGDDPRDGQGPRRGARRRPGRHRHRLPDGRRGPADGRRDGPVRAPRQVGDEHPPAARRGRDHHALELPDGHPVLEDDAGARDRQHGRLQAVVRHAALRDAPRRADGRGRLPAGRRQPRDRRRAARSATRSSTARTWRSSRSPAPRRPARTSPSARPGASSASRSSSVARTASSCWPTPTSTSPPTGSCGRPSARPASAARPRRGSSSSARSWSRSSSASRRAPGRSGSGPGSIRPSMSARSSTPARSTRSISYVEIGRGEAELVLGGGRATAGDLANGHFFEPTIFAARRRDGPDRPGGDLRAGPLDHPGRRLRRRRCWRSTRPATACRRASSPAT